MRDYMIITESTTDLSQGMVDDLGVHVIPFEFSIDEKNFLNYPDNREMSPQEFYRLMKDGKTTKTSQVNVATFSETFEKYLSDGKDVLCITLSSGISGTYNSAVVASKELKEKYPDQKIVVVDSKSASLGEGMLVYNAAIKKRREGFSIDQLQNWIEDNKNKLCHWFTVDDLNHLKRGGRISAAAATFGKMLGIKPILRVDDDGCLVPVKKVRGRKSSLLELLNEMENTGVDLENQIVFLSHGDCEDDAEFVKSVIMEKFKVKDVVINHIGPAIGAHAGPGTIALFFWGKHR